MKLVILTGMGVIPGLFILLLHGDPIAFESLESKTADEQPVFNQVRVRFGWKQDVWVMKQSHLRFPFLLRTRKWRGCGSGTKSNGSY